MGGIARITAGSAVVALLAYVWLPDTQGAWMLLGPPLLGVVGGLAMGSRWAVLLAPAAVFVAGVLRYWTRCPDCPRPTEPTPLVALAFLAALYGSVGLGAAAGVAAARRGARAWRAQQSR